MSLLCELDTRAEVHAALATDLEGLHTGRDVGFARRAVIEAGDQACRVIEASGDLGRGFLGDHVGRLPLIGREREDGGREQHGLHPWRRLPSSRNGTAVA
jgi:hypothetical protein